MFYLLVSIICTVDLEARRRLYLPTFIFRPIFVQARRPALSRILSCGGEPFGGSTNSPSPNRYLA